MTVRSHMLDSDSGGDEGSQNVDLHHASKMAEIEIKNLLSTSNSRACDHVVDSAERPYGILHHCAHSGFVRYISPDGH